MNKGTEIEKVIVYLEKLKQVNCPLCQGHFELVCPLLWVYYKEGYTHVAITTPDKMYDSSIFYDECSRKNEGVLRIGSSCPRCLTCFNYSKYRKEDIQ